MTLHGLTKSQKRDLLLYLTFRKNLNVILFLISSLGIKPLAIGQSFGSFSFTVQPQKA